MPKLSRLIIRTHNHVEKIRKIDRQPELDAENMAEVKQLALERLLSMVSDTVGQIPAEEKERFPDIPWAKIAGMRNELAHNYENINPRIIRNVLDGAYLDDMLDAIKKFIFAQLRNRL